MIITLTQDLSIAFRHVPLTMTGTPGTLLNSDALTLAKDGSLRVAYAPFDHIALGARIVLVGITPGRTQALAALKAGRNAQVRGLSLAATLREAKLTASFSGAMRANLIATLDAIGVPRHLKLNSAVELFAPGAELVHLTSALRYPVFRNDENYNGSPDMIRTPMLRRMIEMHLAEEVRLLPNALWLPLGPKPAQALRHLAGSGLLDPAHILDGMPHPSGANAERIAVFLGRKAAADASSQTNGPALVESRARLRAQIDALQGASN